MSADGFWVPHMGAPPSSEHGMTCQRQTQRMALKVTYLSSRYCLMIPMTSFVFENVFCT